MQVFRLMAMPDKVIAFDELPERLLEGFEMYRADKFPRHWREWMGTKKKITKIPPEKDMLTGQVRRFDPIVEEDSYFYMVDWTVNPVVEKWKEVCDFVRQHVDKETRLQANIDDMAIPLAPNKSDGVSIEPEEVPVIKIPVEYQEKTPGLVNPSGEPIKKEKPPVFLVKCTQEGCVAEFDTKQGLRMHMMKKHPKPAVVA